MDVGIWADEQASATDLQRALGMTLIACSINILGEVELFQDSISLSLNENLRTS